MKKRIMTGLVILLALLTLGFAAQAETAESRISITTNADGYVEVALPDGQEDCNVYGSTTNQETGAGRSYLGSVTKQPHHFEIGLMI